MNTKSILCTGPPVWCTPRVARKESDAHPVWRRQGAGDTLCDADQDVMDTWYAPYGVAPYEVCLKPFPQGDLEKHSTFKNVISNYY